MSGLSQAAEQIIESLSQIEILRDYQLIGGTALAITINHRLSEDLDFCKWVPDSNKAQHAVDAKSLHEELKNKFGEVECNHLGFSQVNFYVTRPGVRITFYHTDLQKPPIQPKHLMGNIHVAELNVLAGSKMYVITRRRKIRDYYDILILTKEGHCNLDVMLRQANFLSREVTPKKIAKILKNITFTQPEVEEFQQLNPKFIVSIEQYKIFFNDMAQQIEAHIKKGTSLKM